MAYTEVKFSFLLTAFPYKPFAKKETFGISFVLTFQPIFLGPAEPKSAASTLV